MRLKIEREKRKLEWEKLQGEAKRKGNYSQVKILPVLDGWLALAICKPGIESIRKSPVLVVYFKTQSKRNKRSKYQLFSFVTKEYA